MPDQRRGKTARLASLLTGGNRRSLAGVPNVLAVLRKHPERLGELIEALADDDSVVRMRAADALEKATREEPKLLRPYRRGLVSLAEHAEQIEVRWHLALLLARLTHSTHQLARILEILDTYLQDRSAIVRTLSMQALADLAAAHPKIRAETRMKIWRLTEKGTPAMKARGRRLLKEMGVLIAPGGFEPP
ncbi:MAG TPA: hypothetical protein VGI92_05675 [Gemmatimonadales bacterium]